MSMRKQHLLSVSAAMLASTILTKQEHNSINEIAKEDNPFDNSPIPFINEGFPEWKYTPSFTTHKNRKCSNKKYHKRKKAKNGR